MIPYTLIIDQIIIADTMKLRINLHNKIPQSAILMEDDGVNVLYAKKSKKKVYFHILAAWGWKIQENAVNVQEIQGKHDKNGIALAIPFFYC